MSARVDKILDLARDLSEEEETELLERLGYRAEPVQDDDAQIAFTKEMVRRVDSIRSGEAVLHDLDDVVSRMRAKYAG